jgi:regulator of ribonuclease activity A
MKHLQLQTFDENEALLSCVDPILNHFGKKKVFRKNHYDKLFEDNSLENN